MKGLTSMIRTVLSGLSVDANTNRSVRSRRASSPGNLSMAALKWLDIMPPLYGVLVAVTGGRGRPAGDLVARRRDREPRGAERADALPVGGNVAHLSARGRPKRTRGSRHRRGRG